MIALKIGLSSEWEFEEAAKDDFDVETIDCILTAMTQTMKIGLPRIMKMRRVTIPMPVMTTRLAET